MILTCSRESSAILLMSERNWIEHIFLIFYDKTKMFLAFSELNCEMLNNKLKSLKVAKWRKDEWRMIKVEGWMMKDDDFKLLRGFCDWLTDGQTNERTDICECRVAFATEKVYIFSSKSRSIVVFLLSNCLWAVKLCPNCDINLVSGCACIQSWESLNRVYGAPTEFQFVEKFFMLVKLDENDCLVNSSFSMDPQPVPSWASSTVNSQCC